MPNISCNDTSLEIFIIATLKFSLTQLFYILKRFIYIYIYIYIYLMNILIYTYGRGECHASTNLKIGECHFVHSLGKNLVFIG
jgi:hypothetical protein